MNNPGLGEPIQDEADKFESIYYSSDDEREEREDEKIFLRKTMWFLASTAFPLTAGTFGPIANAFSICALSQYWRIAIPPGGTEAHGQDIRDPKWLLAINAVSLVLALASNLSLLLNMARRLKFSIAQPITIIGWYLASFLLIGLVAPMRTSALHKAGVEDQALSQAYYYAIIAAVLYFIISSLMVINVYGAYRGHYGKDFNLTVSQRTLMLQTISYLTYLLAGAAVYSHVEGWKFLDAVYWANFTLLTIGIGDYSPSTHLGRSLLFPYAIGGIVMVGLVVGSIRSLVLERSKAKMSARITERTRQRVLKKIIEDESHALKLEPIEDHQQAELRRRELEFNAMRRVQEIAATERKWISLLISGGAWFILWFIGAVVFWKAERNQNWTYFQSLYFSYTSLLTIGYGDLAPYSNSGKPFFVFWSLLAVPTLTILISNMGDTIVKMIKEVTLWVGEVTFLPGDAGIRDRLVYGLRKATAGKLSGHGLPSLPPSRSKKEQPEKRGNDAVEKADRITKTFERHEWGEENEARKKGDGVGRNTHYYHYLLVKEIRKVYQHMVGSPEKKYSYNEWKWFLKLIGEDEGSAQFHRTAPIKVKRNDGEAPDIGKGQTKMDEDGGDDQVRQWSWIGNRSPLMGAKSEPEWVLERLCRTLEQELKIQKEHFRRRGHHEPPVKKDNAGSSGTLQEDGSGPSKG